MPEGNSRFKPFPTTRWNLISRVSATDPVERGRAIDEICELYRPPVRAYIRNLGHSPHDSDDLVQEFFLRFLKNDSFQRPDPKRGSLRRYLRTAVKRFLAEENRRGSRQKRGGGGSPRSIDGNPGLARELAGEIEGSPAPDRAFEIQWAATLLENVLQRLEEYYRQSGQESLFGHLGPYVRIDAAAPEQKELAAHLGISEATLRVAIHRLRQRYRKLLLDEIAATLAPGDDVEEELSYLRSLFV